MERDWARSACERRVLPTEVEFCVPNPIAGEGFCKNTTIQGPGGLNSRIRHPPFRLSVHIFVFFDDSYEVSWEPDSVAQSSLLCNFKLNRHLFVLGTVDGGPAPTLQVNFKSSWSV